MLNSESIGMLSFIAIIKSAWWFGSGSASGKAAGARDIRVSRGMAVSWALLLFSPSENEAV